MAQGLELAMQRKFGNTLRLRSLNKSVMEIASLDTGKISAFYLITKKHNWQKPTYKNVFQSLINLKNICTERKITHLACPHLECGPIGLDWETICSMLCYIFRNSFIIIKVMTKEEPTQEEQLQILKEFYENLMGGHQGITRTYRRISHQDQWKGMRRMIKDYVLSFCQLSKTTNRTIKEPMVVTTTASRPFEKIIMDIVGPIPKSHSRNSFILTMQDDLSKFAWAVPMYNHEANTVAHHFVTKFVCLHGLSQSLVTDCGTEFLSKVFKEVCNQLKIKQPYTSPYRPQGNGLLERSHRILGEYLRSFANKDPQNWDAHVPFARFYYNSTVHSATNFQPYEIVY